MNAPTEKQFDDVEALSKRVMALVKEADCPGTALNALLTTYINLASACGLLEMVPGAGIALGHAAEQLLALRPATPQQTHSSTSLH
ncbi:MAG: hypothetical protein K2X78_02810 [Burkholderiaceae bacterium]|nr:hypothetical protein [Burkholderiaceae bacterium]